MPPSRPRQPPSRSYAGQSQQERTRVRRARFVEAGRKLFGTVGYRRATVRALCKEAGLTDRYFYESFASIEDLLVAVYEVLTQQLQGGIVQAIQGAPPRAGIARRIEIGVEAFFSQVEDPVLARIVWLEVLGVSPRVDALYNRTTRGFAEMSLALGRDVAPELEVPDALKPVIALGVVGALSELAKDWLMTDYARPRAELVKAATVILLGVVGPVGDAG